MCHLVTATHSWQAAPGLLVDPVIGDVCNTPGAKEVAPRSVIGAGRKPP